MSFRESDYSDSSRVSWLIPEPWPFAFDHTVRYLSRSSAERLVRVDAEGTVRFALPVEGKPRMIEIRQADTRHLVVHVMDGRAISSPQRCAIETYIREWFDLDRDLEPFYAQVKDCPLVGDLIPPYYGLRIVGVSDLFEAMVWAILGQQINLGFAYSLKKALVETYGESHTVGDHTTYLFPSASHIARLRPEDLMLLKLTAHKAEYVVGVARMLDEGTLSKQKLLLLGSEEARTELEAIRGIGPWTAQYVLMRCLRDPRALPLQDVGLHNAIRQRLGWSRKPTIDEVRAYAKAWEGHEAYATFYLWQSLATAKALAPVKSPGPGRRS